MGKARKPALQLELPGTRREPKREAALRELTGEERDQAIRRALAAWFEATARDLPWRRRRDPYAVWLSEIMLQQTRVETVVPYFERFLSRFPDVGALSAAPIDEVLSLWSGLGYYRRARQLHATAREVTERYGGAFPGEAAELKALPGVGDYTAGAIASLAFGRKEALVDGNVARVFARLFGIAAPIRSPAAVKELWETARRLLPEDRPGQFNEALMELGAMVCTPRDARCEACPLERVCVARATGRVGELPVVAEKPKVPVVAMVAAVVRRGGEVLFARRQEGGLFGGLWEPPMVEAASVAAARAQLAELGVDVPLAEVGRVKHVLTHKELAVRVAAGEAPAKAKAPRSMVAPYEKATFLDPEGAGVGISTLARKVLASAAKG
uniref:Adenine DNA glycosylase n=1 Tax=Byssovorax cruenta TaxID=293647 RepID=A0A3S5GXY5_9BACT|nr:A/G-specific adenine glycosylase [Byssovorax cruenta]